MCYEIKCPICKEIKGFVEDRLFELRQTPDMTDEKRSLSHIELILHEADEYKVTVETGGN